MDPGEPLINPRANNNPRGKSEAEERKKPPIKICCVMCLGGRGNIRHPLGAPDRTGPWSVPSFVLP